MKREIVDETGIDAFVKEAVGVSADPADKSAPTAASFERSLTMR